MQLSLHADYSLRVLLYLGANPGRVVTTKEISEAYGISRNHLVRVVQTLGEHGYVRISPGRSGGLSLALSPRFIRLGDVFSKTEPNLSLVECFNHQTNTCPIIPVCGLKPLLSEALDQFIRTLNSRTLADLLCYGQKESLKTVFINIGTSSDVSSSSKAPLKATQRRK